MKKTILFIVIFCLFNSYYCVRSLEQDYLSDFLDIEPKVEQETTPTIEVKVVPPKSSSPMISQKIQELENLRKENESHYLKDLKDHFENEIIIAGKLIDQLVTTKLQFFSDSNFFQKDAVYKKEEPMTFQQEQSSNGQISYKVQQEGYRMKQIGDEQLDQQNQQQQPEQQPVQLNTLQPDEIHKLPDEEIINQLLNSNNPEDKQKMDQIFSYVQGLLQRSQADQSKESNILSEQENNDLNTFEDILNNQQPKPTSFLQMGIESGVANQVTVKFHNQNAPDPELLELLDALESDRTKVENQVFEQAKFEMSQITNQTIIELEVDLEAEMFPFFVSTQNLHTNPNTIYDGKLETLGLLQLVMKYPTQIEKYFPNLYQRSQDMIKESLELPNIESPFENVDQSNVRQLDKYPMVFNNEFGLLKSMQPVSFVQSKLYEFTQSKSQNQFRSSNLNVKLTSDKPYPTIFSAISAMQSMRDNAEKVEIQKILQIEEHLQKIEADMIKSALQRASQLIKSKFELAQQQSASVQQQTNQQQSAPIQQSQEPIQQQSTPDLQQPQQSAQPVPTA